MSIRKEPAAFRVILFALAISSTVACSVESEVATDTAHQAVINSPLPSNLNLILKGNVSVTIGPLTQVFGDVGSPGVTGSVLFDVGSTQGFANNIVANIVHVAVAAQAGHVFGNDITVDGFAAVQTLGIDPTAMSQVPAGTASAPGSTDITIADNQSRQLCPGQYGTISIGANATLNLNGGVYDVTRLVLADGARLEPSEPVVLLVAGGVTTGTGATIAPFPQVVNPMTAADIRIEAGSDIAIGSSSTVRAHLLASTGRISTGTRTQLQGAAWANVIAIGASGSVSADGVFLAQAPSVPPPCNDNNACTADQCVGSGTAIAFCRNTAVAAGSSCEDGNTCNGAEVCNATGQCQPGTPVASGTSCADGDVCNGDETCNGTGTCVAGAPPVVNDGNACTADACDPETGVAHIPLPDGTTCSGIGVCHAGTCSVQGAIFSQDFFQFEASPAQCDAWTDFRTNQVVNGSYSSVSMSGTFEPAGVTCNEPAAATQICGALHQGSFASVFCSGRLWNVGDCFGLELSIDNPVCTCNADGHSLRPCIGDAEWGGVNGETCFGPTQNIKVICQ